MLHGASPRVRLGAVLGPLLCAACATGSTYGGTTDAHTKSTVAGAGSGSGGQSQAAASSASTGTSGGSTSGATGGSGGTTGCPAMAPETLNDCGPNGLEIRTSLIDYLDNNAPIHEVIQFSNAASPGAVTTTDACGNLVYCAPDAGALLSLYVNAPGYIPTYFSDIRVTQSDYFNPIPMFTEALVTDATSQLQTPPFSFDQASVMVHLFVKDDGGGCTSAGWTFSATDPDGGVIDAGVGYVSGVGFGNGDATTQEGLGLIYDLPSDVGSVAVQAAQPGALCSYIGLSDQFTGTVRTAPSTLSVLLYPVE